MRSLFTTAGRIFVYVLQLSELWGLEKNKQTSKQKINLNKPAIISFGLFKGKLSGYLESVGATETYLKIRC